MKTIKELFEQFQVPVDSSGWDAIANDPTLVRHNRAMRIRKPILYSTGALAVVAAVVVAVAVFQPHEKASDTAANPASTPTVTVPTSSDILTTSSTTNNSTALSNAPVATKETALREPAFVSPVAHQEIKESPDKIAIEPTASSMSPATPNTTQTMAIPTATASPSTAVLPPSVSHVEPTSFPTTVQNNSDKESTKSINAEQDPIPTPQPQNIEKTFFAPNAFSPNSDGTNDIFYVYANIEYTDFELNIYSRNGDHVFQSKHIDNGWNGRRNGVGELLPQGVYVYTIKYKTINNKSGVEKGQILLIQ
ncbi:MAG: gliding motility-associated C-terminal domain-containing protein [Bacteroidales bacterium]|nr:gliding motility-associated C-terminal domain-containing protein [Bacteroidales bacterium]